MHDSIITVSPAQYFVRLNSNVNRNLATSMTFDAPPNRPFFFFLKTSVKSDSPAPLGLISPSPTAETEALEVVHPRVRHEVGRLLGGGHHRPVAGVAVVVHVHRHAVELVTAAAQTLFGDACGGGGVIVCSATRNK